MKRLCFFLFIFGCVKNLWAFPFDLDCIKAHIDEKFATAVVETDPFPHLIVENILPEDLYLKLLAEWPEKAISTCPSSSSHWRKVLSVGDENWSDVDRDACEVWKSFAILVVDGIIKKHVGNLFHSYKSHRFGEEIQGKILCNSIDIQDHKIFEDRGNGIPPHVDPVCVFAPIFIYFPALDDLEHEALGTYFYKHIHQKESEDISYEPLKCMKLVKIAPFKSNTLCSFMQTPRSWHSSKIVNQFDGYVRRLYGAHIYLSEEFVNEYYDKSYHSSVVLDKENYY